MSTLFSPNHNCLSSNLNAASRYAVKTYGYTLFLKILLRTTTSDKLGKGFSTITVIKPAPNNTHLLIISAFKVRENLNTCRSYSGKFRGIL